jgi:flagellar biosynthesis/type III secretory pathway M-ring protein FliF/YscJ
VRVPQEFWANALYSVTPTILVGLIFWFVLRAIIRADRTERSAFAKVEAEERAKAGLPPKEPATPAA